MKTQIITIIAATTILTSCTREEMFVPSPVNGEPVATEVAEALKTPPVANTVNFLDGTYEIMHVDMAHGTQDQLPGNRMIFREQGIVFTELSTHPFKGTWNLNNTNGTVTLNWSVNQDHPVHHLNGTWKISNHNGGLLFADNVNQKRFVIRKLTAPISSVAVN